MAKIGSVYRRLFKNTGTLLSGDALAAGLSFIAVLVAARTLGPAQFGRLALIQSYVLVMDRVMNFQSWQALIKFGAELLIKNDTVSLKRLIKFGAYLDGISAVAGAAVSACAVFFLGTLMGWTREMMLLAAIYSLAIAFNVSGTPIAILRLFDNFKHLAVKQVVAAALKAAGVIGVALTGGGLPAFIMVWMVSDILGNLFLIAMARSELRRHALHGVFREQMTGISRRFPGLWHFVWTTNLNGSIRLCSRELDILIIGTVLGDVATGLYKIAKQFASVLFRISDPLYQAVFPELARIWAAGAYREFRQLIVRTAVITGAGGVTAWILTALFGRWMVVLTAGPEFGAAETILVVYMAAAAIAMAALPLQPAMLAMGQPGLSFWIHLLTTALYFPVLMILMDYWGLAGAGAAYVIYYLIWTLLMTGVEIRLLRRSHGVGQSG